jgi:hypothetical protein
MKNLRINLCVLVLASLLCALTPDTFAQNGNPPPIDPHHITNVDK